MFLVFLAEGFIHLFQAAGKIFLDMMTGLIPMLICLLLAINFLMKLVGTVRMEKVAALLGRSRILTYGALPVLGWFFMSSPGALPLGKLLPEKSKPGYEDALGPPAHPLPSLFPHVVPSELFVWLGVAAGVRALGLPVASLALRYIAAAMLIGFIALISGLNALFDLIFGISFQGVLGFVFYPFAWVMGVPAGEALQVGSIMATKLVSNEFVAMMDLQKIAGQLSPHSEGILSVFLVSFANFSSIGIVAGAIKGLNEEQGNVVSRFGLKLVYGSTLVSVLSASIAALVL